MESIYARVEMSPCNPQGFFYGETMPFDANGNYSLPPGTLVTDGETILASQHNPAMQDISSALSATLTRDGRSPMTGNMNANGYRVTGLADGISPQDAATVGQASFAIGDFKDSVRRQDSNWLRRNGGLYAKSAYPELAALLPPLADGVNWSQPGRPYQGGQAFIDPTSTGYMIVSRSGTTSLVYQSDDGETWRESGSIASFGAYAMAQSDKVYVLGDGDGFAAISNNGSTWTRSTSAVFEQGYITGLAFGAGLIVGMGGTGLSGGNPAQLTVKTTVDGVNWIKRYGAGTENSRKLRWLQGRFVGVGTRGLLLTSPDGINWQKTNIGDFTLNDIAFDGTTYVAVGDGGGIYTSTNLINWTKRASGVSQNLSAVTWSTSGFIAVGENGAAVISGNGINWTVAPTGVGAALTSVIAKKTEQNVYLATGNDYLKGVRTLPTQFQVPNDNPTYGWIKAKA